MPGRLNENQIDMWSAGAGELPLAAVAMSRESGYEWRAARRRAPPWRIDVARRQIWNCERPGRAGGCAGPRFQMDVVRQILHDEPDRFSVVTEMFL